MRHNFLKYPLSVAATAAALAACGELDTTTPGLEVDPAFTRAAPSVPLGITVQDDDGLGGDYRVRSDGGGEYVNGVQTVIAEIDGFGNLQFRVLKAASPARALTVDFSVPFDLGNTYAPPGTSQEGFTVLTNKTNNGNPSIADLGVGGNPSSGCYNTTVAYSDAATSYQTRFNTDAAPLSTFVRITRASISPATWSMVANESCGSTPYAGELRTQLLSSKKPQPFVVRGVYDLRFSMVLRGL